MNKENRTFYIKTFGCQMNVYDSERIAQILMAENWKPAEASDDADLVIVNSCSVREKAKQKFLSALGRYHFIHMHRGNSDQMIVAAGCVAQEMGAKLLDVAPYVGLVVGPDNLNELPRLIERAYEEKVVRAEFQDVVHYRFLPGGQVYLDPVSTYVTVMKGCNKKCAYCIVPYTRGVEISKPFESIIEEIQSLVSAGIKEVMLLGQNVNSYGFDRYGFNRFPELLASVSRIDGLQRLRFTTSHPIDCSDELLQCFGDLPNLCEHFHLPIQAGSNRVLQRMGRMYTREHFLDRVEKVRKICPHIALSTDIIVGFPGESNVDFQETLSILREVEFDSIFSFKYSPREGTPAAGYPDDVPAGEKQARLAEVHQLQEGITQKKMKENLHTAVEVIVSGLSTKSKRERVEYSGRTRTNLIVNFEVPHDTPLHPGDSLQIRVTEVCAHSLKGSIIYPSSQPSTGIHGR